MHSTFISTVQVSLLVAALSAATNTFAQDDTHQIDLQAPKWHTRFTHNYTTRSVRPINLGNSGRLDSLVRAGRLYLSLQDAVALALENNIDIET